MSFGKRFVDVRFIRERMERKSHRMAKDLDARTQPVSDFDTAEAMRTFGGSFVQCLGRAWHHADEVNRAKIFATWPEYVAEYRELARLKRVAG